MSISPQQDSFQRKIKTREQLREAVGPHPRDRTVIMCHGTFDLVHPGHIRHLMYAKDHADVLIASLTSDAHINKANFRPFVPQDLRAMNLAALECVDYVIIDDNATPIENLKFIQPDFFAKGYEPKESIRGRERRWPRSNRTEASCFSPRAISYSHRRPSSRRRHRTSRLRSSWPYSVRRGSILATSRPLWQSSEGSRFTSSATQSWIPLPTAR
jgi:cytidyltransferase-like protein